MKQVFSSLALSLLFIFGALGALGGPRLDRMAPRTDLAAPGEVYCVISQTGTLGPFAPCTQVFTNIQTAVDTASGGETIRVATGLYTDVHMQAGITQVVYLSKTVHLQGGYSGDFAAWNPAMYPTILDAQERGRVFYLTGTISIIIEGFEITGGKATGFGGSERSNNNDADAGGGLYLNGVTVTLRHNVIHHNAVSDRNTSSDPSSFIYSGAGGALYLANGYALLDNNVIYNNIALRAGTEISNVGLGGGLYIYQGDVILSNNTIYSNIANDGSGGEGVGGGVYIVSSTVTLTNNLIHSNVVCLPSAAPSCYLSFGGGLAIEKSTALLTNNTILSNTAVITGSVGLGGGVGIADSRATVKDNLIQGNVAAISATTSAYGGGLMIDNDIVTLTGNIFRNNSGADYGGGLYIFDSTTFCTNTVFVANRAISGAGLMIEHGSTVHLHHTTFNDNGVDGSDIYIVDSYIQGSGPFNTVLLTNTIMANHTIGISVTAGNTLTLNSILWYHTPITINAGTTATVFIANAFSGDPAFAADEYHLTAKSAAIGRGIPAGVPTDIDGDPRRPIPDLGADEYWSSPPTVWCYLPLILKAHQNQF